MAQLPHPIPTSHQHTQLAHYLEIAIALIHRMPDCIVEPATRWVKMEVSMIPIRSLFESHLTVSDLQRSMSFFGETLGLELAEVFWERRVAFYWIGGRGNSMLGLWEAGATPQRLSLHIAFRTDLPHLLGASAHLRAANVVPLDFDGQPTDEPVVLGWMPAASLYFRDPDGNMIELLSMLPDSPQLELGIVGWSRWNQIHESVQGPMP